MLTTLIVLVVLLAKTQMELPLVESQKTNEMTINTLVAQKKEAAKQAYKRLRKHFLVQQERAQSSQKNNDWQLHGIVKTGDHYFALIKQQAKLVRYELGDTLLDYGTIIAVHANGISVGATAEQPQEYKLYQNDR